LRIRSGDFGNLARDPKGEFLCEEECVPRLIGAWFEDIAGVAELSGERRKFFSVAKEPIQAGSGWKAESEKDFKGMSLGKDHFICGEPCLDGFFSGSLAVVAAGVKIPFATRDQQSRGRQI